MPLEFYIYVRFINFNFQLIKLYEALLIWFVLRSSA